MNPANIPTQEHARACLNRYAANEKVSDLYDGDEQFANALHASSTACCLQWMSAGKIG